MATVEACDDGSTALGPNMLTGSHRVECHRSMRELTGSCLPLGVSVTPPQNRFQAVEFYWSDGDADGFMVNCGDRR